MNNIRCEIAQDSVIYSISFVRSFTNEDGNLCHEFAVRYPSGADLCTIGINGEKMFAWGHRTTNQEIVDRAMKALKGRLAVQNRTGF